MNPLRLRISPLNAVAALAFLAAGICATELYMGSAGESGGQADREAVAADPGRGISIACHWTDPVGGRSLAMRFSGSALIACRPNDAVRVRISQADAAGAVQEFLLQAPAASGPHMQCLSLGEAGARRAVTVCLYVPDQAETSQGDFGRLSVEGKLLGTYRDPAKSGVEKVRENAAAYAPPRLFLRISAETGPLFFSPSLRLQDLVVPDEKTGERHSEYVPVCYPLVMAVEALRDGLAGQGVDPSGLRLLSIFRTPIHNHRIGSGTFGRHKYCDALDLLIDADMDKRMDDLNGDGRSDRKDGLWLVALVEELQADGRIPAGGIGLYTFATGDRNVTLHVDIRGHRARWAFQHDRRGRRQEFAWQSRRFAAPDKAEQQAHPERWSAAGDPLPELQAGRGAEQSRAGADAVPPLAR